MNKNEIKNLIELWKKRKSEVAFYKLLSINSKKIYNLINSITNDKDNVEDLFNEATIGFIKALNDFDFNSNEDFNSFCERYIKKSIIQNININEPEFVSLSLDEDNNNQEQLILEYSLSKPKFVEKIDLKCLNDIERKVILNKYMINSKTNIELCKILNISIKEIDIIEKRAFQKIRKTLNIN